MRDLESTIARLGGVAATHELFAAGFGRGLLSAAATSGRLIRVRQGWYATPAVPARKLAAFRVGGRLACSSALAELGAWSPLGDPLHVEVPSNGSRLRRPDSKVQRLEHDPRVLVHWGRSRDGGRLNVSTAAAFDCAFGCLTLDQVAAAADSLLRIRPSIAPVWESALSVAPSRIRDRLSDLDGFCESGAETIAWLHLKVLCGRVPIRRQVDIPTVGRVDFVLGERLIVEVDGREHHGSPSAFDRDRRRDAAASALGYRTLRFSAVQVELEVGVLESATAAAIRRGDHRV